MPFSSKLLYSTNAWISWYLNRNFNNDTHYVWCSPVFDGRTAGGFDPASLVAPSSNPAEIWHQLRRDSEKHDRHSDKIAGLGKTWKALAAQWAVDGRITADDRDEMIEIVDKASFDLWRPLIYIVPIDGVLPESRIERVKWGERAALGPEYRIRDLKGGEFDIMEIPHA